MSSMTVAQARVIDPVLTSVAQGYKHADRVGSVLFPRVDVTARGGKILEFGREGFRLYASRRAPGAPTLHVPFAYEGKDFNLAQDALNSSVPRELLDDARRVPGVDMGTRAVSTCMFALTLTLEAEQAKLATTPGNFDLNHRLILTGEDRWSAPDSNPVADIKDAKEKVRRSVGVDPNRMVVSKPIFNALKMHPKIVDRFKYTSSDSITAAMLANLFDLDMIAIGKAAALEGPDETAQFVDVWGNFATLAYVPAAGAGYEEPSFGYTYTLKGHPFVEQPYWDGDKKSWIYGVTYERRPVLTGMLAGFLFQSVIEEA
ncbi:MAG TPA: major capsid protein [Thermomicrobiales bacterium]|nr:major capsid protein [Thermomicrobiales bacterium]